MSFDPVATVVASAARTTSSNSGALNCGGAKTLNLCLNVSAHAGTTPTLDVKVEWSNDGGTTFFPAETPDAFAQITTTDGGKWKALAVKAPFYRVVWTIAGTTPSYTFDVSTFQF